MNEVRTRLGNLASTLSAALREGKPTVVARLAAWRMGLASLRGRGGWRTVWRGARGPLAYAVAYLLAQYASAALSFALSPKVEGPSPLHLPSGVAVAALLLTPRRRWWLYLLVTIPVLFLDVWLLGLPLTVAVWQTLFLVIVIIVCISVFTASLVRRYMTLPLRFASVSEVARFMICACVGAVPAAVIAATGRIFIFSWDFWLSWQIGLLGYVLGIVTFTPAIVLWLNYGPRGLELETRGRRVEFALLGVATLVVGSLIFGTRLEDQGVAHALIYTTLPLLIWAAVRFGSQGFASKLALVAAIAVTGAAYNRGPFVGDSATANTLALQLFLLFVGVPLFFLAALVQERKQADDALRASEDRYRLVVRNLPNTAVLLFDAERRHRFAEGPGLAQIGLTPKNLEGLTPSDAFSATLVAALAPSYEAALSSHAGELDLEHARHTFHIQAVPLPNDSSGSGAGDAASAGSSPVGMIVLQDVTEQRRARDELEHERLVTALLNTISREFRTLAQHSPDCIARFDPQGHLVYLNPAGEKLLGLPARFFIGKSVASFGLPYADSAPFMRAISEVIATREPKTLDIEIAVAPRGTHVRSMHVRLVPELDEGSGVSGAEQLVSVLVTATDVSSLKRAEAVLAAQASELEAIFEAHADGVAVFDAQGRCVRANPALRQLMGSGAGEEHSASREDEQAQQLVLLNEHGQPLPHDQWPLWRVLNGETLAGAGAVETNARTPDGRERWISTTGAPMRTPDGQISGAVLIARDVGARRALEQQVAEQTSELTAIFEALADGVVVYDKDGRTVRANPTWQAMFRAFVDRTDVSADPILAALPAADQEERWHEMVRSTQYMIKDANGQPIPLEETPTYRALQGEIVSGAGAIDEGFDTLDGHHYVLSISAAPLRDGTGAIVGAVTVARDVTAHRQLEQRVREQAAQLEATFSAITDGMFVLDGLGRMVRINPAARAIFKLVSGEDRGLDEIDPTPEGRARGLDLGDNTGRSLLAAELPTVRLLRGEVLTGETALILRLGSHGDHPRTVSLTGGPLRDEVSGQIVGAVGIIRDVTELHRIQAELAAKELQFRTLVEHTPDIIARFDRHLKYLYINPAIRQVSPLPEAAYVGKTNAELGIPEELYAPAHHAIERVFETGDPQILEESDETGLSDPATNRYFRARFLPERTPDGRVESVLTVTTDITPLKRTEQALREAIAHLETARQEEARRTQIAESLRGVVAILNSKRTSRDVLQYIVHQAADLLGGAAAAIYGPRHKAERAAPAVTAGSEPGATASTGRIDAQADTQAEALRVQAVEGLRIGGRKVHLDQRLPFAHAAVAQALASAQPVAVVVDQSRRDGRASGSRGVSDGKAPARRTPYSHLDAKLPAPYHALLVIPIRIHDGIYGCLLLLHHKSHTFTDEEVALSQTYADQVAMAITNARLQSHLAQEAAAAERNRLAQELHDTVKQELFSASLVAQSLPSIWRTHRAEAEAGLHTLHTAAQSAYAGLQALLLELRPAALEQMTLSESLRQLSAALNARAGVPISVEVLQAGEIATDRDASEPPLPAEVKVACYRIAQEALMNAAKYARAHTICVRLQSTMAKGATRLELEIADDGVGFDPTSVPATHYGLAIMHERAQSVGARVQIHSHSGQGTVVNLIWQGNLKSIASEYADYDALEASVRGGSS